MKNQFTHIIEKMSVELSTNHLETADKLKNDMSIVLRNSVLPQMEQLFDEYDFADNTLRINILDISIDILKFQDYSDLKDEIIRQILDKLSIALKDYTRKSNYIFQKSEKAVINKKDDEQFLSVQEYNLMNSILDYNDIIFKKTQGHHGYTEPERDLFLKNSENLEIEKNNIESESKAENFEVISAGKRAEAILFFFLKYGFLPWYGTKKEICDFVETKNWVKKIENSKFIEQLVLILGTNQWAATRFSMLMKSSKMLEFFEKINPKIKKTEVFSPDFLKRLPKEIRLKLTEFMVFISVNLPATVVYQSALEFIKLLNSLKPDKIDFNVFELKRKITSLIIDTGYFLPEEKSLLFSLFEDDVNKETEIDISESVDSNKQITETEYLESMFFSEDVESVYVSKAGLILLHPFLKQFFRYAEFLDVNDKIKSDSITPAVQILSYLSDRSESFFEGDMVFCKFLCGIPLKMPVSVESILTKQVKEEAERLLKEVIRNWPALKNSSPGDLRNLFLQRDGKLIKYNRNYRLIVERKAQDILLDKLNWSISVVKIPWIDALIYVEW